MFTLCPKCALTLVVTAADLRVAQGYVRCGRCSSVFNALARLTDERGVPAGARAAAELAPPAPSAAAPGPLDASAADAQAEEADGAPAPPAAPTDEPEDIPDAALEFNPARTDVNAVFVEPPPNPQWAAATGSFKAMLAANQEPGTPEATQPPAEPPREEPSVDVEIDAAFLAAMLHAESQDGAKEPPRSVASSAPQPQELPPPPAAPPEPPQAPPAAPPAATGHHKMPATPAAMTPPAGTALAKTAPRHVAPHARPAQRAAAQPAARAHPAASTVQEQQGALPAAGEETQISPARAPFAAASERLAALSPQVWRVALALGVLLLMAQIVNHYRDDLATNPRFYQPLTRVYGALGVRLTPHWDLHGYDVRQL